MVRIRFGPAGIPLSCKGRTLKDGIEDVHTLELNAIEVQLVRAVGQDRENLEEIGKLAEELDVSMSVHTPYYMDLLGDENCLTRSVENIQWSAVLADRMGANIVATHIGLYGEQGKRDALERATEQIRSLRDWMRKKGLTCHLGLETSGRKQVFGSLEEILYIVRRVEDIEPVLNFAHIHSLNYGSLKHKEDFQAVFDKVAAVTGEMTFYTHFSGVIHEEGDKKRSAPIKKGDMSFEPLADCILDNNDMDVTIISSSPLMEHDAMYMKVILDRVQLKRSAKAAREARAKRRKKQKKK